MKVDREPGLFDKVHPAVFGLGVSLGLAVAIVLIAVTASGWVRQFDPLATALAGVTLGYVCGLSSFLVEGECEHRKWMNKWDR